MASCRSTTPSCLRLSLTDLIHCLLRYMFVEHLHRTANAFSTSGMLLCNGFGDINEGCRYADIALKLYERFWAREWTARVYCACYGFCFVWKHPLRTLLKPLLTAHHTGFSTGDIEVRFRMSHRRLYMNHLCFQPRSHLCLMLIFVTSFICVICSLRL